MSIISRNCRYKIFVEGVELSSLVSDIGGLSYSINAQTQCSITLECPNYELLTTEWDIQMIQRHREGGKVLTFNNLIKDKFLLPYLDKRIFGANDGPDYSYVYGLFSHIVPINANVRVFQYIDGRWYFVFTGIVRGRSKIIDSTGRVAVTLRCGCALTYLRLSTITESFGIWEPISKEAINKAMQTHEAEAKTGVKVQEIEKSEIAPDAMFVVPNINPSVNKFGMVNKERFLDALVFSIFGEVLPYESLGNGEYGGAGNQRTIVLLDDEGTIVRNKKGVGLFTLENIQVRIWGEGEEAQSFFEELTKGGTKTDAKGNLVSYSGYDPEIWDMKQEESLDNWDELLSNEVKLEDLTDLSVTGKYPKGVNLTVFKTQEDIVNFIGSRTKLRGLYDTSGGSLKVLLPGSLTKSVYDILRPENDFTFNGLEFATYQTRLSVFSYFLTLRSNFIFYASAKGHIVVEFPFYDVDSYGLNDWRVFDKSEWSGSYSDTEDFDALYSAARDTPEDGAWDTTQDGSGFTVPMDHLAQGAINPNLLEKIGLKILAKSSVMGLKAGNPDQSRNKAVLALGLSNREAYNGSIVVNYQPRSMINRSIKIDDVGVSWVVRAQTFSLAVATAVSSTLNLVYMKQRGADGKMNIAFGSYITALDIDYSKWFGKKAGKKAGK